MDASGLIELWPAVSHIEDLLYRDDVRIQFGNHVGDALRHGAAVEAPALVNVVGGHPNADTHCWRSKTQPTASSSRSYRPRSCQSLRLTCLDRDASFSKSAVRRRATSESRMATLISSLMPNERLSRLAEPTTLHMPSTIMILAWIIEGSYS